MNDIKLKRSLTSVDEKLNFLSKDQKDQNLPKEMPLRQYRAHFVNKKVMEVIPQNNHYQDICLTPIIQPIIQPIIRPKSAREEPQQQQNKKVPKKETFIHIPKVGSAFQSASFIIDEGYKTQRKQETYNEIKLKENSDLLKFNSNSQIGCFSQSIVLPIDLNENKTNQLIEKKHTDQYRLPYINSTPFADYLMANKPSFINNYRQSGTNQNSFRLSARNFPIHFPPKVWLRSRYFPGSSSSWIKQSDR